MHRPEPMVQTMQASEARRQWSRILNRVFRGETRVLVEKNGIPVAAIISATDLEQLRHLETQRRGRFRSLDEPQEAFTDVPPEALEQDVPRTIDGVRPSSPEQRAAGNP